MNSWIRGLCVAFSMYSTIPMPKITWDRQTMRYALCFLPMIGAFIGIGEWFWYRFCIIFRASELFYAVGATLLPVLISGGIHLDGLADACDAIGSHREPAQRLEIMKDPHIGAFGVLGMIAFLLCETALFAQLYRTPQLIMIALVGFTMARVAGSRAVVAIPCAKNTGLAHLFAENSEKEIIGRMMNIELVVGILCLVLFVPGIWGGALVSALFCLWIERHTRLCKTQFGGMTGDLAGFLISIAELLFIAVAAIGGLIA